MRRIILLITSIVFIIIQILPIHAAVSDDMGHFGGVSEGSNLPKTIEKYVDTGIKPATSFQYKEIIFISGEPIVFEGTLTLAIKDDVIKTKTAGTYTESYTYSGENLEKNATMSRTLRFTTSFRVIDGEFKKQVLRDSTLTGWTETLSLGDATYTLNPEASTYSKTGVEDITPGVSYFQTSVSYVAQYVSDSDAVIIMTGEGADYGYNQPWSKIETQKRELTFVSAAEGYENMEVSTSSVLEAKKTMYYDQTLPFPISFQGTYNQRLERNARINYTIHTFHPSLTQSQMSGEVSIVSANEIEKLPIPENLDMLEGHWAEEDFKQLYSMEIMTEIPHIGMQYEAMSRGDFIKTLVLAMNLDTRPYENPSAKSEVIFGDVAYDNPLYPYIMAAYKSKLVKGTGENFSIDVPITREEAFVVYVRVIGLERLGVTNSPTTPFVDDNAISSWAKKEILAGYKLGIIKGNDAQKVLPKSKITKAEAAAIVNRLISYLREDIAIDYKTP